MRVLQQRRKLMDIAKTQSEEIKHLQTELTRLRYKTFPSFGPRDARLV